MINVNMIPNQSDIMKISSLVNDIKKNKKTKEIEYNIRRLFKKIFLISKLTLILEMKSYIQFVIA